MNPLRHLISEIHRRSFWQVLAVYVVGAWVAYQVILDLVEGLGLPEWLPGFAVVLFVIGLPIVLAAAMVRDDAPAASPADPTLLPGSALDDPAAAPAAPAPAAAPASRRLLTWRAAVSGGVAMFAVWGVVAAVLAFRGVPGDGPPRPIEQLSGDAGTLTVTTTPAGARVRITPVRAGSLHIAGALDGGVTPVRGRRISPGEYLLRIEATGHHPVDLLLSAAPDGATMLAPPLTPESAPAGMLLVPAGPAPSGGGETPAFLMDRFEVTNAQYADFVSAGGYQNPAWWPDTLLVDGEPTPWAEAMPTFVDRSGHAGPRGWSGGLPPAGHGDHPVVGVSWYEAGAFARWAGKALPSWDQWWRAALGEDERHYPWGDGGEDLAARANFGLVGTAPVGSPLGLGPFGMADMAGNVREWLADAPPDGRADRRRVVGGGWADPVYMFEPSHAEAFPPDFAGNQIGFRCVAPPPRT
ncbi:MAG TPA: SUMF1/EgtB/PvdO family nonheme iron enzyme [Longimicrobiales bacterium]|nr:SUMF1/EgtB/PvdO family nonheme iron enzyme [Longimicrobiales bacterium]